MKILKSLSVLALSLIAVNAFGQSQDSGDYPLLNDPFQIYFGGFYPSMSSEITINGDVAQPPPIGIEDTLGVEEGKFVPSKSRFFNSIVTGSLIYSRTR